MEYITLRSLVDKGFSTYKIAEELDTSQTNVRYWLKKHGLKTNEALKEGQGNCEVCGKPLKGRQTRFCSKKCKNKFHEGEGTSYESQKRRRKERKELFVEQLGGKCKYCGYDKHYAALSFHHKNGDNKKWTISNIYHNKDLKTCQAEVKKCILLCENCHRELHNSRRKIAASYQNQREKLFIKRQKLLDILGSKCSKCGYDKNSSILSFHHLRDKKYSLTVREIASAIPFEELKKEVEKCILLCANCHAEEHAKS